MAFTVLRKPTSVLDARLIAVTALAVLTATVIPSVAGSFDSAAGNLPAVATAQRLHLAFAPNRGQAHPEIRFLAQSFGGILLFTPDQLQWSLPAAPPRQHRAPHQLTLQFQGVTAAPEIAGGTRLPGVVNYLMGGDPADWLSGLPTYEDIVYKQLYPGIDLHYTGDQTVSGRWSLKSTYTVAPGADPGRIRWQYRGAEVRLDAATGELLISVSDDDPRSLVERAPVSWQEIRGKRVPVESRFKLAQDGSIHFNLGSYDPDYPLVIDPTLEFSSYLGTSTEDFANGIAVDSQGNIVIVGWTDSIEFPTTPDALQPSSTGGTCLSPPPFNFPFPCNDGFVTKLTPDGGTLLYSTYLGGTGDDGLRDLAIDASDTIYLTGWTTSTDFPTVNPIQPANGGAGIRTPDAFVARLSADGGTLHYSTYLGGTGRDYGENLAVDDEGNAYIVGWTESTDFPTVNPVQPFYGGGFFDAIVAKVNAAGDAFAYSTYLGGADLEYGFGIDVDGAGSAFVTGFTLSDDFPTMNAMQPVFGGGVEAYVTRLSPDGSEFIFSTYFGTNDTRGFDVRVDESGRVYLVGATSSSSFPVINPIQSTYSGTPMDGVVSRFLPDGSALDFSSYLGGDGNDVIHTLDLDTAGTLYFTGWSTSTDFPMVNPLQAMPGGGNEVIVGTIESDMTALGFSTYLGGGGGDLGFAVAVDARGRVHIAGTTTSADFPVVDPLQLDPAGGTDSFLATIDKVLLIFADDLESGDTSAWSVTVP